MISQVEFDLTRGEADKQDGIGLVASHGEAWMEIAREVAKSISQRAGNVSSDDLRALMPPPHHPNAWGAIFHGEGWVMVGWKRSSLVSNHGRMIRVWEWQPKKD